VTRQIRKYLRDFLAIIFMMIVAAGVGGYILSNQRFYLPAWVPVVGTDFYKVKAELGTAQAVVPGQGQSVNIAGVKIGDIGSVKLEDGRAVVDMNIRRKYAPIYKDASILLRPKTGLKDMFLELDPGNKAAGELEEGERVPVAQTIPDVNPDEILASLDTDTRDYLRVLLNAGAEAFDGDAPKEFRQTFKRFEPLSRDGRKATQLLIARRRNIRRTITNFQELANQVGSVDKDLAALIDSANANFEAIAAQDTNLREALRLFPGALEETRDTLADLGSLSGDLGPALTKLRPGARALAPSLRATRPFLRGTTPAIRDQIRPFARDVRPTVRDLRGAAKDLAVVTPSLTKSFKVLNSLFNTLAYNPRGAEEGYLFWASWLNHAGAGLFAQQDAHGPVRRGIVLISCPSLGVLEETIRPAEPQLDILTRLLNAPTQAQVCANRP
jgi:phospholipid/cholesterol/gamma-HCH transport system substrate-binding protein